MKKIYASLFLAALLGSNLVSTVAFANEPVAHEEEKETEEEGKKEGHEGHHHD